MIVTSSDRDFEIYWDCLYEKENRILPFYSSNCQKYYAQRPLDEGKKIMDKSFILLWENEPAIAFRGATVINDGKIDLLAYEVPCISIESKEKLTTKTEKNFLKEFYKIENEVNGSIKYRDFLIDGKLSILSRHFLSKGAKVTPVFSKVIDLNKDESILKSHLRKSYGSLVNWGLRELQPQILDSSNVTWENINDFRELHIREAGRETRSAESWRRQFEMVQSGEAFVVFGKMNDELISVGFFMYNPTNCFYGVSASRRDMFEKPLFHALMWTAIIHAKNIGCHWFDLGDISFPKHSHETNSIPTKKELGISEFKTGFGGKTICQLLLTLDRSKEN